MFGSRVTVYLEWKKKSLYLLLVHHVPFVLGIVCTVCVLIVFHVMDVLVKRARSCSVMQIALVGNVRGPKVFGVVERHGKLFTTM